MHAAIASTGVAPIIANNPASAPKTIPATSATAANSTPTFQLSQGVQSRTSFSILYSFLRFSEWRYTYTEV